MTALWFFIFIIPLNILPPAFAKLEPQLSIVTEEWPPITFEGDGLPRGMGVELVQEIQKIIGNKDPIQVMPWARAYNMVLTKPNVVLFTVAYAKDREKKMTFLGPIGSLEIALFAKNKEPVRTLESIPKDAPMGVMLDTIFHSEIVKLGFKNVIPSNSHIQTILQLNAGRVEYIIEDSLYIRDLAQKHSVDVSKIKKIYTVDRRNLYFGFSKGTSQKTIYQWRDALAKLLKNGTMKKIFEKWLPDTPIPKKVELFGLGEGRLR